MQRTDSPRIGSLAEIVSPRVLEDGIASARAMFSAVGAPLTTEVAVTAEGPRWYVRATDERGLDRVVGSTRAAYAYAELDRVAPEEPHLDPALRIGRERVRVLSVRQADRALPLRADWRGQRDPLASLWSGMNLLRGERVVVRLSVRPAGRRAAAHVRGRRERPVRGGFDDHRSPFGDAFPIVTLLALAAGGLQGWRWHEASDVWQLAAAAAGALIGVPLAGALAFRAMRGAEPLSERLIAAKLAAPLLAASLEIAAFGPADTPHDRLESLARTAADALRVFDDSGGGALEPHRWREAFAERANDTLLLNAAEAAGLWHLPAGDEVVRGARRTRARRLAPPPGSAERGSRVGTAETGAPVALPATLLHRNQLIVAKTRRGKSTLLRHLAAGTMERVAVGVDQTALAVIDPHQDLAEAVLASVPDALADRVVYLDFADLSRPIGLNLLDVALFPDRDRTTEHVITMLNRLWPANWGPRMEGALRASLSALHEANAHREREEQYTLLDVAPFLTDRRLRERVLEQVEDPALTAWFRDNYNRAGRVLQQQTANPVTSKIGRFTVTEASRLALGQARSTFDPHEVLGDGAVLVVNTAVGTLGEGAASLIGATLLNLLGLLVEEQVAVAPERRRRLVALVDESTTLGAVDYPRMLSELGKYGASFVLVTQALSKLDAIDRNLVPTILANADGLTVFQVSAEDARRLVPELGTGIEVEDLVSLDDYECYARWWQDGRRPGAFAFRVDAPPPADLARVHAVAERSRLRYGRPYGDVAEEIARVLRERSPDEPEEQRPRRAGKRQGGSASAPKAGTDPGATDESVDDSGAEGEDEE